MDPEQEKEATTLLLGRRCQLTDALKEQPYDAIIYLQRAVVHGDLGYPDLASGDAYKALLLIDEVRNEGFEYHEQAREALRRHSFADGTAVLEQGGATTRPMTAQDGPLSEAEEADILFDLTAKASLRCYQILSISLLLCGCLKSAHDFCSRGLSITPADENLLQSLEYIRNLARRRLQVDHFDISDLPDQGLVRREIYPWDSYQPDRLSDASLALLNASLSSVAPKCIVRRTDLPTLFLEEASSSSLSASSDDSLPTNQQLGLFAREDIAPGETVLTEFTLLTASNRLKEPVCDACAAPLPALDDPSPAVACETCVDTLFCSAFCHDLAQESYHPAICATDLDDAFKDPPTRDTPNALYFLLLTRALAMSIQQKLHPLSLPPVQYLCGEFLPSYQNAVPLSPNAGPPPLWTLPFSFRANILIPLHVLEKMEIDVYARLEEFDVWVFNTLYAKFRGVASARIADGSDGRWGPDVAAVHPLWCLANHNCEPNVEWEWGGRMVLKARREKVGGGGAAGGIRAGEEILNHYCDIELPVRERREWAKGSLGGLCMCDRCRREEKEEEEAEAEAQLVNGNGLRN